MRPIDADALVAILYERVEECKKTEDVAKKFGTEAYYTGRMTAFYDILSFVERMKEPCFDEQLSAALHDLRESDMVDCCHCKHYFVYSTADCDDANLDCGVCKRDCPCKTCKNNSNWEWRGADHD